MPGLVLGESLPGPDVSLVPDPDTGGAAGVAPPAQHLPGPVPLAVTAEHLLGQNSGEQLPVQLHLDVVTQVGQESLVPLLATVLTHSVLEHHLEQNEVQTKIRFTFTSTGFVILAKARFKSDLAESRD